MPNVNHFIPKYFGLTLGNSLHNYNGWNGDLKDWHLCLGNECYKENNFEEFNCAEPI